VKGKKETERSMKLQGDRTKGEGRAGAEKREEGTRRSVESSRDGQKRGIT